LASSTTFAQGFTWPRNSLVLAPTSLTTLMCSLNILAAGLAAKSLGYCFSHPMYITSNTLWRCVRRKKAARREHIVFFDPSQLHLTSQHPTIFLPTTILHLTLPSITHHVLHIHFRRADLYFLGMQRRRHLQLRHRQHVRPSLRHRCASRSLQNLVLLHRRQLASPRRLHSVLWDHRHL
jgi:hypothetical protein